MASVILLFGKFKAPETAKLVEVTSPNVLAVNDVFVENTMAPFSNFMSGVPVTDNED